MTYHYVALCAGQAITRPTPDFQKMKKQLCEILHLTPGYEDVKIEPDPVKPNISHATQTVRYHDGRYEQIIPPIKIAAY